MTAYVYMTPDAKTLFAIFGFANWLPSIQAFESFQKTKWYRVDFGLDSKWPSGSPMTVKDTRPAISTWGLLVACLNC